MSENPQPHQMADLERGGCRTPVVDADQLLRQLVAAHSVAMYRYAFRLTGQAADAEDLTQQAFLFAQQKLHQLREQERAAAWLLSIVRNCFLKTCRKKQPLIQPGDWDASDVAAELPTIDAIDQEALAAALADLPEEFRVVVLMFYFEDLSYKEIAEQLGAPIGTVMSRLSRAKGHLRQRLADRHETLPTGKLHQGPFATPAP